MSTTIDYAELAQKGQEQFLAAVRESQQAIVDSVAAWSQTMQAYTPAVPAVPEHDQLPSPEEIVDNTFDLVEKLVVGQREFARNLLAASLATAATTSARATTAAPAPKASAPAPKASRPARKTSGRARKKSGRARKTSGRARK
jgi:hypothetical protein